MRASAAAIFEVATAPDRTAEQIVAEDLTATARGATGAGSDSSAAHAGSTARASRGRAAGLTTLPCGAIIAVVACGGCGLVGCRLGRLGGTLLLAFIVVVQSIAVAADDLGAFVAIRLEAVIADQRADA